MPSRVFRAYAMENGDSPCCWSCVSVGTRIEMPTSVTNFKMTNLYSGRAAKLIDASIIIIIIIILTNLNSCSEYLGDTVTLTRQQQWTNGKLAGFLRHKAEQELQ